MLASDSDSDFEYPADANNSDASDDCVLLGKLALGVDPQDMKAYDGRSTPRNGSQYLMKVMAEKKNVPKVVSVDTAKLVGRQREGSKGAGEEGGEAHATPHYLDRFLQAGDDEVKGDSDTDLSRLPSSKWREETTSCFSDIRSKVEKWQYKVEGKEIRITDRVEFPRSNDNTHWLKFCFGNGFMRLASGFKTKTKEQKLEDFFLDLYDPPVVETLMKRTGEPPSDSVQDNPNNQSINSEETQSTEPDNDETATAEESIVKPDADVSVQLGARPLMNLVLQLNQNQLENLVKWNLMWLQNIGFVNECQGQWLYAILACLFKPVDPSVMSDLRSIVRILIKCRGRFSEDWGSHFEVKKDCNGTSARDERVFDFINTLNLFIYVIADYFQQKDLVMHL